MASDFPRSFVHRADLAAAQPVGRVLARAGVGRSLQEGAEDAGARLRDRAGRGSARRPDGGRQARRPAARQRQGGVHHRPRRLGDRLRRFGRQLDRRRAGRRPRRDQAGVRLPRRHVSAPAALRHRRAHAARRRRGGALYRPRLAQPRARGGHRVRAQARRAGARDHHYRHQPFARGGQRLPDRRRDPVGPHRAVRARLWLRVARAGRAEERLGGRDLRRDHVCVRRRGRVAARAARLGVVGHQRGARGSAARQVGPRTSLVGGRRRGGSASPETRGTTGRASRGAWCRRTRASCWPTRA